MNDRGFTLIEALVSSVVILICILITATLFNSQVQEGARVQNLSSFSQIDRELRSNIETQAQNYFMAEAIASPACVDKASANLNTALSVTLPSGISISPLTGKTLQTVQNQWSALSMSNTGQPYSDPRRSRQQNALTRCATQTNVASFGGSTNLYFCLLLTPPAKQYDPSNILTSAPIFAEFSLMPTDQSTGNAISCGTIQSGGYTNIVNQKKIVWSLYYSIYWNRNAVMGRVFAEYVGFYSNGA